ncbi:PilZ domain-containing protein [bacterium]|nr:MAG: PilZ domain-containing protein [bacterium]
MCAQRSDKRHLPRANVEWEVLLGELCYPVLRARGWAQEVNPRGCKVLSDETIDKGEAVRILMAAGSKLMHVKGRVIHASCLGDGEFELGVSFEGMSDRNIAIIGKYTSKDC